MPSQGVQQESYLFNPSSLLSLYEIDSRFISANGQLLRFHAGVNGNYASIVYNSITYTPFPIEVSEMEITAKGGVPRPKLSCSNINGFISQYLLTQGDMIGARFVRRRVFARFLDASNFPGSVNPWGTPDPTAAYDDEVFYINRKVTENPEVVEFECATPFELDNVKLPRRQCMATVCAFRYLDPETCGYSGVPIQDRFGKSFTAAAPGGYGLTLVNKGLWDDAVTYQPGDYVTIISENDFTYGQTLRYVCNVASTVGSSNNPQFNSTNWLADACPHNLLGCKSHFPTGPLPIGSFPGLARNPLLS